MPNMLYTDVTFIIDRSGSMASLVEDTIGGFNSFIADQRKVNNRDKCLISLVQFDDKYEVNYVAKELSKIEDLNKETYVPRGMTALYDAIGKAITETGERFKSLKEEDRPGKVLFVIITDGQENASQFYGFERLKQMIEHQQLKYSWNFMFIGSDLTAVSDAKNLGLTWVYAYNNSSAGVQGVYRSVSANLDNYRNSYTSTFNCSYTPEQAEKDITNS